MSSKNYAPIVLRLGLAFVFLWFGINQLLSPNDFMGYLPEFLLNLSFASTLVLINGVVDLLEGIFFAWGKYVKLTAAVAFVHLLVITISVGYNDIAIRDVGLLCSIAALYLWDAKNR